MYILDVKVLRKEICNGVDLWLIGGYLRYSLIEFVWKSCGTDWRTDIFI